MKKNVTILRIIAAMMVMLMLVSAFAACAETTPNEETTAGAETKDGATQAPVVEGPETDVNGFLVDNLPELDFKGETINLLVWDDVEHEEFEIAYENLSGDIVEQSIYDRNAKVSERLKVTLNFIRQDGDSGNLEKWNNYVHTSVSVNAREFDILAGYSLSIAANAANGYLFNMLDSECEYLNFEQPWWSKLLLEQATFGDSLYFASGDISRNALEMMYVCYANTQLLDKHNLENPQNFVASGDWTYDKFIEMCNGVYEDDGDGVKDCTKDEGDVFGYITSGIHTDPWFYGSGATICERDDEGKIVVSESFKKGERVINTLTKLKGLLVDSNDGIYTSSVTHQTAFGQGRSLFMMERARVSHKVLAANYGETEFVILPCPKYDKEQENYITVMGNPFTLYAIASDIQEPSRASAVIECFASEGYRIVTPAVFELSLKTRYVDDPISGQMYDIIRENITYDIGRIFSNALIGQGDWRNAVASNAQWTTTVAPKLIKLSRALDTLNATLIDG